MPLNWKKPYREYGSFVIQDGKVYTKDGKQHAPDVRELVGKGVIVDSLRNDLMATARAEMIESQMRAQREALEREWDERQQKIINEISRKQQEGAEVTRDELSSMFASLTLAPPPPPPEVLDSEVEFYHDISEATIEEPVEVSPSRGRRR